MRRWWLAGVVMLMACSARTAVGDPDERDGGVAAAGDSGQTADAAPLGPSECRNNDDCGGAWCVDVACDAPGRCTEELPCSAAPPFWACTCTGVYRSLASGCPGVPYVWRDDDWRPFVREGDACDPADPEGFRRDLEVEVRAARWPAGTWIFVHALDPRGRDAAVQNAMTVGETSTQLYFGGVLDPGLGRGTVEVFVDVDRDVAPGCTAGDPFWTVELTFGASAEPFVLDLDAEALDRPPSECPPPRE